MKSRAQSISSARKVRSMNRLEVVVPGVEGPIERRAPIRPNATQRMAATQDQSEEVSEEWKRLLLHTLGAGSGVAKSKHGYRNRFCATVGSVTEIHFKCMVQAGYAEQGGTINNGQDRYYRATEQGCKFVGLSKAATKRALEE